MGLFSRKSLSGNQKTAHEALKSEFTSDEQLSYDDALEAAKAALTEIETKHRDACFAPKIVIQS